MRFLLFVFSRPFSSSLSTNNHHHHHHRKHHPSPIVFNTFAAAIMDETMDSAVKIITKWECHETSADYCPNTFLFNHHSRFEILEFTRAVKDLYASIQFLSSINSTSKKLSTGQNLLLLAKKRLSREFFSLLKSHKDFSFPNPNGGVDSVSSVHWANSADTANGSADHAVFTTECYETDGQAEITAVDVLKLIADCMITAGYAKKCLKIYKLTRRSIVEDATRKLGARKLKKSQVQKMDWEAIELKIENWLPAVRIGVRKIFLGERILFDNLFSSTSLLSIRDSCFADVCKDAGCILFRIPGKLAKHSKKSPEKLFRFLDLYEALSELSPDIDMIFSSDLTAVVRSQAKSSMTRITDAVRLTLTEFESSIQKDNSKSAVQGGGVHPLTLYVMNYLSTLTNHTDALDKILADWPVNMHKPLPESYYECKTTSPVSLRLAWLLLVLLCKLDAKSELYKDVSLSYLFLANNLQYVVNKVTGSKLRSVLGEKWVAKHAAKVIQYAANYERIGWGKVISALPDDPTADIPLDHVKQCFRKFNAEFEVAYRKQVDWVVLDPGLKDKMKASVARSVGRRYREMYEKYREVLAKKRERGVIESVVKFTPKELQNYLSDLLDGPESDDVLEATEVEALAVQRRSRRVRHLIRQQ